MTLNPTGYQAWPWPVLPSFGWGGMCCACNGSCNHVGAHLYCSAHALSGVTTGDASTLTSSTTNITLTAAPVVIRQPVDWPREFVEAAWHVAALSLALPCVARAIGRHRALSLFAGAALIAGAVWHCVSAVEGMRREVVG